jgi:6-phosphogluconolactonase (cycloisomerase 2 family)
VTKLQSVRGYENPRNIVFWHQRNELYVGHKKGKVAVYDLNNAENGPICKAN